MATQSAAPDLQQSTTVDLDWASGTTVDTVISDPVLTSTTDTAQGTYALHATPDQLGTAPAGAKYLLAVVDPNNDVTPADPSKVASLALPNLVVTTQPPQTVALNSTFDVQISAEDGSGNVDTSFNGPVTIALDNNPTGATLGGTLTENAVNGVADFPDLTVNQAGSGYTLQATRRGPDIGGHGRFRGQPGFDQHRAFLVGQPLRVRRVSDPHGDGDGQRAWLWVAHRNGDILRWTGQPVRSDRHRHAEHQWRSHDGHLGRGQSAGRQRHDHGNVQRGQQLPRQRRPFTITINESIIVLDPSARGALSLSGNASIDVPGVVYVDSSSSAALSASGSAKITAYAIDVVGGDLKSGKASFNPGPTTGANTLSDPLSGLALPSVSGMQNYGTEKLSGNSSATIQPGIYSQISVSGNAKLTLSGGVYIIDGGGFSVSGNASVTGSGVMIVNAGSNYPSTGGGYGGVSVGGNGSCSLSPLLSGTYAGIEIFQPKDNAKGLSVSGNASRMTGVIYAPAAQLNESGNARLNAAIIVDTMTVSGNAIEQIPDADEAGPGIAMKNHGRPAAPAAPATLDRSSEALIALDLVLADSGTTAGVTASGLPLRPRGGRVAQKAGRGSNLHTFTTSTPPAIDPGAVDALHLEGLSLRSRQIAHRPGQPMKWSL